MDGPFAISRWIETLDNYGLFLFGFSYTLSISLAGIAIALSCGIASGLMATSKIKILNVLSRVYVEFFQNTPLLTIIFFLYFVVPKIGVILPPFLIGIIGIGVYHGAYMSEVVRSGVGSVPAGQFEAGKSQGFGYIQLMRYIILPQTIRIILPPMTNQFVNLIKNTSILTIIAVGELMYNADTYAQNGNFNYGPAYTIAGLMYFCTCFALSFSLRLYENKLKASC